MSSTHPDTQKHDRSTPVKRLVSRISGFKKYREIILSIALFVLLDAGVLVLNFYNSYQIANDAHAIQLASHQASLSQKMLQQLYLIRDQAMAENDWEAEIDKLAPTFKQFDEVMDAFIYGGELIGQDMGQDALLKDAAYADNNGQLLASIETTWSDYRRHIQQVVYAPWDDALPEEVEEYTYNAIAYGNQHNEELFHNLQQFSEALEAVATRKAERVRTIQLIGIILAIINFFLILFHFLRRLTGSDRALEQANKENREILDTVTEGLFLLRPDMKMGQEYSKVLETIFKKGNLSGANFIEMMRPHVASSVLKTVEDYMSLLFASRIKEKLILDLNPLEKLQITLEHRQHGPEYRYLSFSLSRIYQNDELQHLLVTVRDITRQVELEEQLQQLQQQDGQDDISQVLKFASLSPASITQFVQLAQERSEEINRILENATPASQRAIQVQQVFRITHDFKARASSLGFGEISQRLHRMEDQLNILQNKSRIDGQDFLAVTVELNHIYADIRELENIAEKVSLVRQRIEEQTPSNIGQTTSLGVPEPELQKFADEIAHQEGKRVLVDDRSLHFQSLPLAVQQPLTGAILQLIRNAITHGIESPQERDEKLKNSTGLIEINHQQHAHMHEITIRDDGAGIRLAKIKQTALDAGLVDQAKLETMTAGQIVNLLFTPGFSTRENADQHAGRGIGLDVVREEIRQLGGHIRIKSRHDRFTCFTLDIPTRIPAQPRHSEKNPDNHSQSELSGVAV